MAGYSVDPRNQLTRQFGPALSGAVRGAIPLWTFGKLTAARDAAEAGVEAARGDRQKIRNKVIYDVRRAYYGLQFALDVKQMISEGLPKLEQAQQKLREQLDAGDDDDFDPVDAYRLDSAVLEVQARQSEATRLENSARNALTLLTGREQFRIADCPIEPVSIVLKDVQDYVADAGGSRPEVSMLRAANVAKKAELAEKRARYLPDIALGLEAQGNYIPGRTAFEHYIPYYLAAGLVMRWDLDIWGHYERSSRVEHEQAALRAQTKLAKQGVRLDVETQYEAVADAHRRLESWAEGHKVARRWFITAAQGYQVGTTTAKELVDGVSAYFKARFANLQAILDLNTAVSALEQAVGSTIVPETNWSPPCVWEDEPEEPQEATASPTPQNISTSNSISDGNASEP